MVSQNIGSYQVLSGAIAGLKEEGKLKQKFVFNDTNIETFTAASNKYNTGIISELHGKRNIDESILKKLSEDLIKLDSSDWQGALMISQKIGLYAVVSSAISSIQDKDKEALKDFVFDYTKTKIETFTAASKEYNAGIISGLRNKHNIGENILKGLSKDLADLDPSDWRGALMVSQNIG